jgi:NADH:ubiquinone oxidoreductase subunit H
MTRFSLDIFDLFSLFFSWYIKPVLLSQNLLLNIQFVLLLLTLTLFKILSTLYLSVLNPLTNCLSIFKVTSLFSVFIAIKFVLLIALLIFVRGGIPRYRYDFLTKLGWIKTLSLVLALFIINLLLSYL